MNPKLKLEPVKIIKATGLKLLQLRGLIILLVAIGLIGYAGVLARNAVDLKDDSKYLQDQRAQLDQSRIKFDKKTIDTINNLQQINPQVDLSNLGKSDPFSP